MPGTRRASDRVRETAQRELTRFLAAARQKFTLHRALAFGSFARGDMHELSDLDLVLIGDFQAPPRLRERALRELAWEIGVETPLQVMALTDAEFERARHRPFLAHVLKEAVEISLPPLPADPRA